MIRIILVDDHNIVRKGIKAFLEKEPGYTIVGEGADGLSVINLLGQGIITDIVLTDLTKQGIGGLELVET